MPQAWKWVLLGSVDYISFIVLSSDTTNVHAYVLMLFDLMLPTSE